MRKLLLFVLNIVFYVNVFPQYLDPLWEIWKYEHGITIEEYVTVEENINYYITWSSSAGSPWIHDIFNKRISFDESGNIVVIQEEQNYISAWEAQEPISTSINPKNNFIFSVFEDGSDSNIPNEAVNVHGQIHKPDGTIIKRNFLIAGGPDAQHSAVSGYLEDKLLAVYVDDNMGSSGVSSVMIEAYDGQTGDSIQALNLTPLTEYHWWPVIESTTNYERALCVWIEDIENLNASIIYVENNQIITTPHKRIMSGTQFVNHQVNWLEKIERFAVIAKRKNQNKSQICLIDTLGNITLQKTIVGAVFQEAKPAVKWSNETQSYIYLYPTGKNDLNVLSVTQENITFENKIVGDDNDDLSSYKWKETGIWSKFVKDTVGNDIWNNNYIVLFVIGNYNTNGVHIIPVHIDKQILTNIEKEQKKEQPDSYRLNQNYPNPFNPATTIKFVIKERNFINISVFNYLGQKVEVLKEAIMEKGEHEIIWNAKKYGSGVYFYSMRAGDYVQTRKMILLR